MIKPQRLRNVFRGDTRESPFAFKLEEWENINISIGEKIQFDSRVYQVVDIINDLDNYERQIFLKFDEFRN